MRDDTNLEKFELASPGWFAFVQERLEALHRRYRQIVAGEKFSMCEVYRNVPAHICPGSSSLAWSLAFNDGDVDIELRERTDVTVWISWDYEAIKPIAQAIYSDDHEAMARVAELREKAVLRGDRISRGALTAIPPGIARLLNELHNELAIRTV